MEPKLLTLDEAKKNLNMTVPLYLMASYAYYEEDNPILSDSDFDYLSKIMLDNWNCIEHYHKSLVSEDMLRAGTYLGDYPLIVKEATKRYR